MFDPSAQQRLNTPSIFTHPPPPPQSQPSYAATRPPSYASAAASGRGAFVPHLDLTSSAGLVAFRTGPRRDPLSRETHVLTLAGSGRSNSLGAKNAGGPFSKGLMPGSGIVPSLGGSWETDIERHSQRQPLMPATGVLENNGRYDGVLGSGAAGAAHPHLGLFGQHPQFGGGGGMGHGPPPPRSPHFDRQAGGFTEEGKRQFLLTNERARRGSDQRWQRTNTLNQYQYVPLSLQRANPPSAAIQQLGSSVAAEYQRFSQSLPLPPMPRPPATASADYRQPPAQYAAGPASARTATGTDFASLVTPAQPPPPPDTPAAPRRKVTFEGSETWDMRPPPTRGNTPGAVPRYRL